MLGQMQDWPLTIHKIIDFAAIQHPNREVVSRLVEGPIHRTNYREVRGRAMRVAQLLAREGIRLGQLGVHRRERAPCPRARDVGIGGVERPPGQDDGRDAHGDQRRSDDRDEPRG